MEGNQIHFATIILTDPESYLSTSDLQELSEYLNHNGFDLQQKQKPECASLDTIMDLLLQNEVLLNAVIYPAIYEMVKCVGKMLSSKYRQKFGNENSQHFHIESEAGDLYIRIPKTENLSGSQYDRFIELCCCFAKGLTSEDEAYIAYIDELGIINFCPAHQYNV
jgi:hypothetical protein